MVAVNLFHEHEDDDLSVRVHLNKRVVNGTYDGAIGDIVFLTGPSGLPIAVHIASISAIELSQRPGWWLRRLFA